MKVYQIYFSPTGGTKKVAEALSGAWDCGKETVDLLMPETEDGDPGFSPEDICIVAVPAFGGRVPGPALERLRKMNGGGAVAVLAAVYGNREIDDTLLELEDTLTEAGFSCAAAVEAVAQHSIFPRFGAGRPDEADRSQLQDFAGHIREYLEKAEYSGPVAVPGNRPYREYNGVPLKPGAGKLCNGCGKCAEQCPVKAIPREDMSSVDKEKCISCMHCVAVCPVGARHNSKILLAVAAKKMEKSCAPRKENKLYMAKQ